MSINNTKMRFVLLLLLLLVSLKNDFAFANCENKMTSDDPETQIHAVRSKFEEVRLEVSRVIVGQEAVLNALMMALIADGHVLLDGVPGLAKTLTAKTLAEALDVTFSRQQFTPETMPGDFMGTPGMLNSNGQRADPSWGPIFTNFFLADEINRTPSKTQAGLLEAMAERQVTLDGKQKKLDEVFFVVATENPLGEVGTFSLPEAQLDRFLFKVNVGYPTAQEEAEIILRDMNGFPKATRVASKEDILAARRLFKHVKISEDQITKISNLIDITRNLSKSGNDDVSALAEVVRYGASPRGSIGLARAARAKALLSGRLSVVDQDIIDVAHLVLDHRIIPSPKMAVNKKSPADVVDAAIKMVFKP